MRISVDQLPATLKSFEGGEFPQLFLINSDELLLRIEAADAVRNWCFSQGYAERKKYSAVNKFDFDSFAGQGQTASLFSQGTINELDFSKNPSKQTIDSLAVFCAAVGDDDVFLLSSPQLDRKHNRSASMRTVIDNACVVDGKEVAADQFPQWLQSRLQSRSLRVEKGVVELLAQMLEGNLAAAAEEVDKLALLAEDGAVPLALAKQSLADRAQFSVFILVDTCLLGDLKRTTRILHRLRKSGLEPIIVTWALAREIRLLSKLSELIGSGLPQSAAFEQCRVWRSKQRAIGACLGRHSAGVWPQFLDEIGSLDLAVKGQAGVAGANIWQQLERLCASICGFEILMPID